MSSTWVYSCFIFHNTWEILNIHNGDGRSYCISFTCTHRLHAYGDAYGRLADTHMADLHADCRLADCRLADCRLADCRLADLQTCTLQTADLQTCRLADCRLADLQIAECILLDCRDFNRTCGLKHQKTLPLAAGRNGVIARKVWFFLFI